MIPLLKQLIELQQTDYEILDYQKRLDALPKQIKTSKKYLDAEKEKLDSVSKELQDLQKQRSQFEREVQEQTDHLAKTRVKLPAVKTNKEYTALLAEIDALKEKISGIEDRELEMMEALEEKEQEIPGLEAHFKEAEKKHQEFKKQKEADIARVTGELDTLKSKRKEMFETLDPQWANHYQKMFNHCGEHVVVKLIQDQCQGCHQQIKLQLMIDVKIGEKVLQCDRCNRILYWVEEEETETVAPE